MKTETIGKKIFLLHLLINVKKLTNGRYKIKLFLRTEPELLGIKWLGDPY
jgi:hypothetical protein